MVDADIAHAFADSVRGIEEVLILCHSSAIRTPDSGHSNLALAVVRPNKSTYKLYPQDWFNDAGFDHGYQWVTRVVRNPSTGQIHGEGIRIGPFVLDASLNRLAR